MLRARNKAIFSFIIYAVLPEVESLILCILGPCSFCAGRTGYPGSCSVLFPPVWRALPVDQNNHKTGKMKSVLKVVFLFFLCDELGLIKCSDDHHSNGGHGLYSFPHQEGLPLEDFDLPHKRVVPAIPITSSCAAFIDFFGELAANFTQCVVQFARPLRACENCVEQYILAKNAFDYVMKVILRVIL